MAQFYLTVFVAKLYNKCAVLTTGIRSKNSFFSINLQLFRCGIHALQLSIPRCSLRVEEILDYLGPQVSHMNFEKKCKNISTSIKLRFQFSISVCVHTQSKSPMQNALLELLEVPVLIQICDFFYKMSSNFVVICCQ